MPRRLVHLVLVAVAGLLAGGCYCPMLSGRYGDCGCFPVAAPCNCAPGDCAPGDCAPGDAQQCLSSCGSPHCWGLGTLFPGLTGMGASGGVPSQQGPDYVSPQPKFHPVPTQPVFEPLPAYPPTSLIDPGISNPLRSHTATIATARAACLR